MLNLKIPKIFSSFDLKLIALISMIMDHICYMFIPQLSLFRIIGRMAFVLYAFMLVEGFLHTHNLQRYIKKIAIWAVLSEIPYDLALYGKFVNWQHQNIFFTLLIGLLGLYSFKSNAHVMLKILIGVACPLIARFLKVDFSWYGILVIFVFYFLRNISLAKFATIEILSFFVSFKLQIFAFLGFIPIALYNGKLGKKIGNIYYSFYALHLLLLGILKYHYLFHL
ncbi:hypothetical protein GNY06_02675 [Elizabethkingia argentiflava]|uniref:Conjugal transfer protein TraX n=1 Tax=Elizabethkingia argenteiflava TaxID=2681556 RepID=A0A845PV30_9FLAO|nr:TraX family protein [Elizabethkingia argenteiflava]NAW50337.1 hypothetical protein [Elizabethkingia argenteiflava]